MRTLILTFALLLSTLLPSEAQTKFDIHPLKKIEANPINIAFTLSQETDSDYIASTLRYYGYEPSSDISGRHHRASAGLSSGETNTYTHSNGSVIKISFQDATASQPYPYVEVKSNRGSKETDNTLKSFNFKKKGTAYIRNIGHHAKTETHCTHGSQGFLIFHRIKINIPENI